MWLWAGSYRTSSVITSINLYLYVHVCLVSLCLQLVKVVTMHSQTMDRLCNLLCAGQNPSVSGMEQNGR